MAERELSAFIRAVTELFGPEQARLSTEDWLDESELMYRPPRATSPDWRAVTVAASARMLSVLVGDSPAGSVKRNHGWLTSCDVLGRAYSDLRRF